MRIAALQCNFEEDTLAVIDQWTRMGFNTEQLFHPTADLYSGLYDPGRHEDLVRRYLLKAHRKGLHVILYLNIHILGPSLMDHKDEWSMRDASGNVIFHYDGVYPSICLNGPWRDHFFSTLEQVANLDVDGIFLDGPIVGQCHCTHCREREKEWFGKSHRDATREWDFANRTQEHFLAETHSRWHTLHPGRPIYQNLPLHHASRSFVDVRNALAWNDIAGTEGGFQHYSPARNAFLFKPSFTARLLEAVAPDKSRVIFMAADHKPWSWWMHTPVETVHTIASCAASGASVWYGLHGSTELLQTESAAAAGRIFRFLAEHERYYEDAQSTARVGLMYSFTSERWYSHTREETDFVAAGKSGPALRGDMETSVRGYCEMLIESRIPFDMVTDLSTNLSRYKVIILPSCGALDHSTVEALRAFVRNGGTLIAQLDTSLYDGMGEHLSDFALADVFGVSVTGSCVQRAPWNYFRLQSGPMQKAAGAALLPSPLLTLPVAPAPETKELGQALREMPGRYTELQQPEHSFVTEHRFGKGRCYYLAGAFGEMAQQYHPVEYRRLLDWIVRRHAGKMIQVENPPALLEMVTRKHGKRHLVHLINYGTSALRPFESITTARDVRFHLPDSMKVSRVQSLALGKKLPVQNGEFTLGELKEYDLLVME